MSQNKTASGRLNQHTSRVGIRWKFFAYMMLFLCILLGLLWLFQVVFFEEIYKTVRINEIERSAQSIAAISELDDSTLNTYVGQIAQDHEVCTMILDSSGNILSTHDVLQDCTIHNMTASNILRLYANAVQQGGEKLTRFQRDAFRSGLYDAEYFKDLVDSTNTTMGESVIYTKIVSSEARGKDVIIILNTTISPVGSTIRTLQTELLLITAIMAALAALLSFLLAKRVAQPLAKMSAGARQLAGGNYDVHFDASGYREIAELSDSLNYASQELSKTGALQRELIANISHDLRTPLTMIEGYAEVMRDLPGENTPENVQIIIDEAKRLTSLVNDVLDISKIQSGTQTLTLTDFNITETIREVIGRFAKLTEQDGWIIDFHSDEEVMVNADRTRILQVIYNYINNAITHSGSDKVVQVTQRLVEHDGQRAVRIEVTDHGEGIAPDNIEHIWDRYYKVDKLHRRAQTGSGLGLSIVKGILEQHHARYGVESELGKGSTFWFEL